jgi:hypothetical protein
MKLIYSLLVLSLVIVTGCSRPARSTDASTTDPAVTSMHEIETNPLKNSHLATEKFTPSEDTEPEESKESEEPEESEDGDLPEPE